MCDSSTKFYGFGMKKKGIMLWLYRPQENHPMVFLLFDFGRNKMILHLELHTYYCISTYTLIWKLLMSPRYRAMEYSSGTASLLKPTV